MKYFILLISFIYSSASAQSIEELSAQIDSLQSRINDMKIEKADLEASASILKQVLGKMTVERDSLETETLRLNRMTESQRDLIQGRMQQVQNTGHQESLRYIEQVKEAEARAVASEKLAKDAQAVQQATIKKAEVAQEAALAAQAEAKKQAEIALVAIREAEISRAISEQLRKQLRDCQGN